MSSEIPLRVVPSAALLPSSSSSTSPAPKVIAVPREIFPGERRVAMTPDIAKKLKSDKFEILIEAKAGELAGFSDEAYREVGCQLTADIRELYSRGDVILKIHPPSLEAHPATQAPEVDLCLLCRPETLLVSYLYAFKNAEIFARLQQTKVTVFALDKLPRTTQAQKMDTLSSQAKVAGHRAVIEAATHLGRFMSGEMTSAGNYRPAKVLVLGCGVAGLEALGVAKRFGCKISANDVRKAAREEASSLGAEILLPDYVDPPQTGVYAKSISPEAQASAWEMVNKAAKNFDVIITTANIPGRKSPILVKGEAVLGVPGNEEMTGMRPGSILIDLAAANGGNCERTEAGKVKYEENGVKIIGFTDLESRMATQASNMWATNMRNLLLECNNKKLGWLPTASKRKEMFENEILRGLCQTFAGVEPDPAEKAGPPTAAVSAPPPAAAPAATKKKEETVSHAMPAALFVLLFCMAGIALVGPWVRPMLARLMVFFMSCFLGYSLISDVPSSLHTPLLSFTNALSGVIVLGSFSQVASFTKLLDEGSSFTIVTVLGIVALFFAMINVFGGFWVTSRTLSLFSKKGEKRSCWSNTLRGCIFCDTDACRSEPPPPAQPGPGPQSGPTTSLMSAPASK